MRRYVKRASDVARVAGVVLICLALVLTIYVTASVGKPWARFREMPGLGELGFADRVRFDGEYYTALSRAVANKALSDSERAEALRPVFGDFEGRAAAGMEALVQSELEANRAWFSAPDGFDPQAFLDFHDQHGDDDARLIGEIVEYLDSLTVAKGKGKAAKLKPASVAPFFEEAYAARNDDGVSYLQFMQAIRSMIAADVENGVTMKDSREWYSNHFTEENYAAALEAQQSAERAGTASLPDALAAALNEGKAPAEAMDALWNEVKAAYPDTEERWFYAAMKTLLFDESFDGSAKAAARAAEEAASAEAAHGLDAFMQEWCSSVVAEADDRALVGIVGAFWWVVARFAAMWIAGIALVIVSFVMDRLLARHMLKNIHHRDLSDDSDVLLRVEHLCQYFRGGGSVTKAVDDVSFFVKKGEVFGLVGESGCGKTTTGRTVINLYDPTAGDVYFKGLRISSGRNGLPVLSFALRRDARAEIARLKEDMKAELRKHPEDAERIRRECREAVSAVRKGLGDRLIEAQNNALEAEAEKQRATQLYRQRRKAELTRDYETDAAKLSGEALAERKRRYEAEMKAAARDNVMTRMQMIFQDPIASIDPRMTVREIIAEGLRIRGIRDKALIDRTVYEMLDLVGLVSEHADRYPHEFSGGQRQRIGIARAIALEPELIIADEPISALDVSIQAQVINLLNDLRNRMGLTIIFIAHNLSVVKYFSDRIAVMYFGNIVELADSEELFRHPLHPYTKSLLSAIPYPDPHYEKQRKRIEYNPVRVHDYSVDKPSLREIVPGHWIRCNDAEYAQYREALKL